MRSSYAAAKLRCSHSSCLSRHAQLQYMLCAGAIAWHIFTGRPLYEGPVSDEDILGSLLGISPLPFEEDPTQWLQFDNPQVQSWLTTAHWVSLSSCRMAPDAGHVPAVL